MEIIHWEELLIPYEQAVEDLLKKFKHIKKSYKHGPIEHVEGRVKRVSSILDKAARKDIKLHEIENKIDDIAGIRIICRFISDIERVKEIVRESNKFDLSINEERDYLTNFKESGYRSYHMLISCPVETALGNKTVRAEIQIRPMAMNFWARLEHIIMYKYKEDIPEELKERLGNAAKTAYRLDEELGDIHREIFQSLPSEHRAFLIDEIQKNIIILHTNNPNMAIKINGNFMAVYPNASIEELRAINSEILNESKKYK